MTDKREIPKKEDLGCEFKSDLKRLSDSELIDTVVALSNTDGGVLYLGVEDDGTPTGIHEAHSDTTGLSALVSNKTMPPAYYADFATPFHVPLLHRSAVG